jgi:hypothetical protein
MTVDNRTKEITFYILLIVSLLIGVFVIAVTAKGNDNKVVEPALVEQPTTTVKPTTTTTEPEVVVEEVVEEFVEPVQTYEEPAPYVAPPVTDPPVEYVPVEEPVVYAAPAGSIEDLICQYFGDQCQKALSVAWCESRYNPGTVGAAGERGIMQIHPVHIQYLGNYGLTWDDMFDPAANLTYARALYNSQGWGPWTCA